LALDFVEAFEAFETTDEDFFGLEAFFLSFVSGETTSPSCFFGLFGLELLTLLLLLTEAVLLGLEVGLFHFLATHL